MNKAGQKENSGCPLKGQSLSNGTEPGVPRATQYNRTEINA
jgi:hypothetical protein